MWGQAYVQRALAKEGLGAPAASVLADLKLAAELDPIHARHYERALAELGPKPEQALEAAAHAGGRRAAWPSAAGGPIGARDSEFLSHALDAGFRALGPVRLLAGSTALLGIIAAAWAAGRRFGRGR